ncbi:hypothetical protein B0I35DRAFT_366737 [Stachybotrys elegans]|uniref:Uncharacterized protein n=1 Tax=Stachybotrys elegans TaxID=80388 RepID=A0A8K0WWL4_9HYPO|nr:hypothetical protein B0I35DRAFT_366737 [Stachybotrys elegans]
MSFSHRHRRMSKPTRLASQQTFLPTFLFIYHSAHSVRERVVKAPVPNQPINQSPGLVLVLPYVPYPRPGSLLSRPRLPSCDSYIKDLSSLFLSPHSPSKSPLSHLTLCSASTIRTATLSHSNKDLCH